MNYFKSVKIFNEFQQILLEELKINYHHPNPEKTFPNKVRYTKKEFYQDHLRSYQMISSEIKW